MRAAKLLSLAAFAFLAAVHVSQKASADAYLTVHTNPPGARIEVIKNIGIKNTKRVFTPGTWRMVGYTPLQFSIYPSDLDCSRGYCMLYLELTMAGRKPQSMVVDFSGGLPSNYDDVLQIELHPQ